MDSSINGTRSHKSGQRYRAFLFLILAGKWKAILPTTFSKRARAQQVTYLAPARTLVAKKRLFFETGSTSKVWCIDAAASFHVPTHPCGTWFGPFALASNQGPIYRRTILNFSVLLDHVISQTGHMGNMGSGQWLINFYFFFFFFFSFLQVRWKSLIDDRLDMNMEKKYRDRVRCVVIGYERYVLVYGVSGYYLATDQWTHLFGCWIESELWLMKKKWTQ